MSGLENHTRLQFGVFVLDLATRRLLRDDVPVRLERQPFDFLVALVERPGHVVSREELYQRLWRGTHVEFNGALHTVAMKVRRALRDSADNPRFVETIAGRGYRFIAPVTPLIELTSATLGQSPQADGKTYDTTKESVPIGGIVPEQTSIQPMRSGWNLKGTRGGELTSGLAIATGAVILALALAVQPLLRHTLVEEPVTTNADDDPISAAAISPDGTYLMFGQNDGAWLLDMRTRERTAVLPMLSVTGLSWSSDSATVLIAGLGSQSRTTELWQFSMLTRRARKLKDGVSRGALSPDGKRIAFVDESGRHVWTMAVNGDDARPVLSGVEGDTFREIAWSPDGARILLGRLHLAAFDLRITLESLGEDGQLTTILPSNPGLRSTVITRDGRLIYAATGPTPSQDGTTLWECERVDWTRGAASAPRRIAQFRGTEVASLSVTADGLRLAVLKGPHQADVYIGELESPGVLTRTPRRLTSDQRNDLPTAWTRDGTSVVFHGDRRRPWSIYIQRRDSTQAELLVSGPNDYRGARLSPHGESLYYLERPPAESTWQWVSPVKLMRVPLSGGPAHSVFEGRFISFRCARSPSSTCVIGVRGWNSIAFSTVNPITDAIRPVAPVSIDAPLDQTHWDLSPDGTRIAMILRDTAGGARIRTTPLNGGSTRDILIGGRSALQSIDWASDGRGWYTSTAAADGSKILYIAEDGTSNVLRDQPRSYGTWAIPSPDGQRLAILEWSAATNVWVIDRE